MVFLSLEKYHFRLKHQHNDTIKAYVTETLAKYIDETRIRGVGRI